ncbi:hypothetical protein ABPG72_016585 [Tetrahymena utriculariae]
MEQKQRNLFFTGIGGFLKTVTYTTIGSPLEVIRLRLQNSSEMVKIGYLKQNYSGIIDSIKQIAKEEGLYAFWKGNFSHILRQSLSTISSFILANQFQRFFNFQEKIQSQFQQFLQNVLFGGLSGCIIMSLWYPLEVARIKLTNDKCIINTQKKQYLSINDVCKQTLIKEGPNGLYRGFGISCFGMYLYRGLFFALADILSKYNLDQSEKIFIQNQFLLGWSIQFLSQLLTYPFYTISSRMIMSSGLTQRYTQSLQCLLTILKQEGLKSLFRGVSINIFKSLGGASSFVLYSLYLQKQNYNILNFNK